MTDDTPTPPGPTKTDAEIVELTEGIARTILRELGTGYVVPDDYVSRTSEDPRSKKAWSFACELVEHIGGHCVQSALAGIEPPEPQPETKTSDIGLLIRDMIEDQPAQLFDLTGDEGNVIGEDHVDFVDVSDPHNPRIVMQSGAVFVVRIFKES